MGQQKKKCWDKEREYTDVQPNPLKHYKMAEILLIYSRTYVSCLVQQKGGGGG